MNIRNPVSHGEVWRLAGPIILSNISVPMVGAVDTAVMGHLDGPHYLGAIALGAMVFSFLYWGFGFLRMGTTGFVALDHGRGDRRAIAFHDAIVVAVLPLAVVERAGAPELLFFNITPAEDLAQAERQWQRVSSAS